MLYVSSKVYPDLLSYKNLIWLQLKEILWCVFRPKENNRSNKACMGTLIYINLCTTEKYSTTQGRVTESIFDNRLCFIRGGTITCFSFLK